MDKSISFNHFFTITKVIVMIISELAEPFFLQRDLKRFLPLIVFLFLLMNSGIHAQNKPFPQQVNFPGCIKPSNVTQIEMNETIIDFYQKWKSKYLKNPMAEKLAKDIT